MLYEIFKRHACLPDIMRALIQEFIPSFPETSSPADKLKRFWGEKAIKGGKQSRLKSHGSCHISVHARSSTHYRVVEALRSHVNATQTDTQRHLPRSHSRDGKSRRRKTHGAGNKRGMKTPRKEAFEVSSLFVCLAYKNTSITSNPTLALPSRRGLCAMLFNMHVSAKKLKWT